MTLLISPNETASGSFAKSKVSSTFDSSYELKSLVKSRNCMEAFCSGIFINLMRQAWESLPLSAHAPDQKSYLVHQEY
jgi:hypothetical protein